MKITSVMFSAIMWWLPSCAAFAQAPELEWQHCLGGLLYEESQGVVATLDGGCAVLGTVASMEGDVSGNHGPPDMWLVKLDAFGQIQWQHCYGGTDGDEAARLLATSDGGFLLMGKTWSTDGNVDCDIGPQHGWAVKVDALGTIQWQACLAGDLDGSEVSPYSAVEMGGGGYLVVGSTFARQDIWNENHGQTDFFAAKLDDSGGLVWLHCYGGSGTDEAWAVSATPDGNYVIAGTSSSTDGQVTTGSTGEVWVIKIDPEGNLLWNRRMGGSGGPDINDDVKGLVVNPDGSMLVLATTAANDGDVSGNHGAYDVWLVRLEGSGAILAQHCFGGTGNDYAGEVVAAGQGNYAVAGITASNDGDVSGNHGGNGHDAWVFMVDSGLNLLWQKCLGGSAFDGANALSRNSSGEIFTAGSTFSSDGDVSGLHSPGNYDIWAVKLFSDQEVGTSALQIAGKLSIYPSPALDVLNIELPGRMPEVADLVVRDITGRVVTHRSLGPGLHSLRIPVGSWAEGVYYIRLDTGVTVRTARFVKQ